ncbi:shikimate kinase [Listeria ilorinensis]|uniref:shikimate kinase n=1 Tax=Listeria ilorinensis TaxID=2867439 RepID=UPI0025A5D13E|nr:shikimate kinase [Listeria ilorinensis]
MIEKVILIGFMGAGKTTVGESLARKTGLPYLDIDEEIVREQGMPVTEIFARFGETRFRELEHEKLKELAETSAIIATGGGIILNPLNREVLVTHPAPVVYLETDPHVFLKRLEGDTSRPLVQSKSKEEIQAIFEPRIPHYQACADFIINTDQSTQDELADQIIALLKTPDISARS